MSQLGRRLIIASRNRIGLHSRTLPNTIGQGSFPVRAQSEFESIRQIRTSTAYRNPHEIRDQLNKNEVTVLNVPGPLRWRIGDDHRDCPPLLWQFQLHYQEYLLPLAGHSSTDSDIQLIEQTIDSWIEANPMSDRACHLVAWHPYCISRRLPVWFCLMTAPGLDPGVRDRMRQSAHLQAEFLSLNLEWDLQGNHLLENLRALALAGCFFETEPSTRWLAQVRKILPQQIKIQVLPHGEHFERCPMYHCQVLGNFLETLIACEHVDPILREMIHPTAEKMYRFLRQIVHPDGEIPLLGDSCFGEAPTVRCLEQLAEAARIGVDAEEQPADESGVTSAGDYWIFRNQDDFLIFDRGPAGAQTLPAHAHCDLLTLESTIGGIRWLVDSGLYNYEDDPMRWYCRSSLAHNVVCLDDQNQLDVWSKFRMGYRGTTSNLEHGRDGDFRWATGAHDAYRRLGVKKMSRLVGIKQSSFWYCVDRAETATPRNLSGFLHLAPNVQVTRIDDRFRLIFGDHECNVSFFGVGEVKIVESWYCPEFGVRQQNLVLEYTFDSGLPLAGWFLLQEKQDPNDLTHECLTLDVKRQSGSDRISVSSESEGVVHTFTWNSTL
jgi:uncharacterized heparinase superfamily protein